MLALREVAMHPENQQQCRQRQQERPAPRAGAARQARVEYGQRRGAEPQNGSAQDVHRVGPQQIGQPRDGGHDPPDKGRVGGDDLAPESAALQQPSGRGQDPADIVVEICRRLHEPAGGQDDQRRPPGTDRGGRIPMAGA